MRSRAALIAFAALALASCGGPAPSAQNTATPAVPTRETVIPARWQTLFTSPDRVVAALTEFEMKPSPYRATGGTPAFASRSGVFNMSYKRFKTSNSATASVSGPDANHIDKLLFTFTVTDRADHKRSSETFRRIIDGVLSRFEVSAEDPARTALAAETPYDAPILGAHVTVEKVAMAGADITKKYQIMCTITPPRAQGASAPGAQ